MRAAITTDGGGFEVVDLPEPAPGPGELVVRIAACGVCGSDLKARPFMPPGTVMGHEFGGEIVAVGADVRGDACRAGSTVGVLPIVACGRCRWCTRGEVAHCSSVRFIGMGTDAGGFAEFAVVSASHAFALPNELPETYGALVEPFAVGLHGVASAEVSPGDEVLVIGAGGVGLTTVAWARAKGAARLTAADPDPARRDVATTMGATDVLASAADAERDAYDVVIECVGNPELIELGTTLTRPGGRVVVSGACDQPVSVEPVSALLKEITLRFSLAYRPREFREVIDAFADGSIDPTPLLGPAVGLERLGEAFDLVRTAGAGGRVLVFPVRVSA
jgi:(R,R)-butanediol dehydrogenase/meso-butanediol dehydrogenase/diacetyl reductase